MFLIISIINRYIKMTNFKSNIVWNFDKFEPNTVWKAQKLLKNQLISKIQLQDQKLLTKKMTLTSFIKNFNPFALINSCHDFIIMDKKKKSRNQNNQFNFSQGCGLNAYRQGSQEKSKEERPEKFSTGEAQTSDHIPPNVKSSHITHKEVEHIQNVPQEPSSVDSKEPYMFKLINQLDSYLIKKWSQCDQIINKQLESIKDPLAQQLIKHLNKLNDPQTTNHQAKIFLVGNNPLSVQNSNTQNKKNQLNDFFAIKYEDNFPELEKIIKQNFLNLFTQNHQKWTLCKFIVFNKKKEFFLLEVKAEIIIQKSKNNQSLKCVIEVDDLQYLFSKAIQKSLLTTPKAFKDFAFEAHGDYIEYPFKEPIARKRKFMKKQSYSLVFQGGGAKGAAYVGAYKAIKEMKKNGDKAPDITSIMGSSAGGIIALAVSTGIEPYEVQKICNKMETIPKIDKIDRKYLRGLKKYSQNETFTSEIDKKIDEKKQEMLQKVVQLLNEYGIVHRNVIKLLLGIIKQANKEELDNILNLFIKAFLISQESIGQIFDFCEGDHHELNYLGLLLQGALMKGEAIYDIGAQCLVKFVLSNHDDFSNQKYKVALGNQLSSDLKGHVDHFDQRCSAVLKVSYQQFAGENGNRVLFSIINKIFMIIDRNLKRLSQRQKKFILNDKFATTLLKYFDYTQCYNQAQAKEAKDRKCPSLYEIIFNHHKLHPNSKDMGVTDSSQKQEKLKRVTSFLNDQKDKHEITHQSLSQIIGEEYFLDPRNFTLKQKFNHKSLGDLLRDIFTHLHEIEHQGSKPKCIFDDQLFKRELAQIITETLNQENLKNIGQLANYNSRFDAFKESVKKITLASYYKITKIEITCTSVDIDNKILRFFNQKTTPDLPVCRAVQMTGSFPVAFKAQSWKESWGKYFIHYDDYRRQVLLKGHEFTDGGMLANFPIKYFDNDYIRDAYFSHVVNRSLKNECRHPYLTIMLGFGLDVVDSEHYTPNEGEIYRANRKKQLAQKAWDQVKQKGMDFLLKLVGYTGHFPKLHALWENISPLKDHLISWIKDKFVTPQPNQIKWNHINENLINSIPLFRFGFKLLNSFPNSDRNLNLQCFKDKVYRTSLVPFEKSIQQKIDSKIIQLTKFIQNDLSNHVKVFEKQQSVPQKQLNPINLSNIINNAVQNTPLKKIFFDNINDRFDTIINAQKNIERDLTIEQKRIKKITIKNIIFGIISSRMKLDLSSNDILWHTLDFLTLKFIESDANYKQKQNLLRKQYISIELKQTFENYKQKVQQKKIKLDARYNSNSSNEFELYVLYKRSLQNTKWKLISQRKDIFLNKLSLEDKKIMQNIQSYFFSENDKYLIQFIFLSKINANEQKDLDHANKMLQQISVIQLLRYFQKSQQQECYQSYITIKDLKAFYRRMFSHDKSCPAIGNYNSITLLQKQSIEDYQYEQLAIHQNTAALIQPKKFNESTYLCQKIRINSIVSETLSLKRAYIKKIDFINILDEGFLKDEVVQSVKEQLYKVISNNPVKYNKILTKLLYPKQQKQIFSNDYFQQLLSNQNLREHILQLLFNKKDKYYSNNQQLLNIYKVQFERFKEKKEEKLKAINESIYNQYISNDFEDNPINLQIQYLQNFQEKTNYQLLISRIISAKYLDYRLNNAHIESKSHLQSIKKQIDSQQQQNIKIYDQIIQKAKLYQSNLHFLEIILNHIQFLLDNIGRQQNQTQLIKQIIKPGTVIKTSLRKIREQFINRQKNVIKLPVGSIRLKHIEQIYTLQYNEIKEILKSWFLIIKRITDLSNIVKNHKLANEPLNQQQTQFDKLSQKGVFKNLINTFNYVDQIRIKLPQFETSWSIYKNCFISESYTNTILQGLNKQFTNTYVSRCKHIRQTNKCNNPSDIKIHLILEGSDLSNYYYAYYYDLLKDLKNDLVNKNQIQNTKNQKGIAYQIQRSAHMLNVKAITTSSYHSIFGFLIALNYSTCQLKQQMSAIREISHEFEDKKLVQRYFNSYEWSKINSTQYKQFWSYIKQEQYNLFNELEKIANYSLPNHNLTHDFSEVRSIYEHEQEKMLRYCEDILDSMSTQIQQIDNTINPKFKYLEISKKYANDYICNFNRQHQYSSASEPSFKFYQLIVKTLFNAYGSLIEGIITNAYTAQIQIKLPASQPGFIFKGFVVKQLLTTFKIKEYVIKKLKENNLRQNITLSEFFKNAPHKILLNFTTINVHKERLEFMNKNTLPNMPIWAAIVAASCLPYFYRDFQCPRQWEHPASDTASLYDIFVNDFFKSNIFNYKNARYISGNIISSIPLQLLTNETTLEKVFTFQNEGQPYLHIGFAFDSQGDDYANPLHILKRTTLDSTISAGINTWWHTPKQKLNQICTYHKDDPIYELSKAFSFTDIIGVIKNIISKAQIKKYIGLLSESNDNYMLHTYWDRLIRLPIKFGTLDFHEITNSFLKRTYGADVPSDKAKDTVERSYEITKYFERKQFPSEENKRYDLIIRTTIVQNKEQKGYFAKIQLLSHSKWNRNRFNNFLVYYSNDPVKFDETAKIAMDSEILWNISDSSKVYLRFYFPKYAEEKIRDSANPNQREVLPVYSSILFTQFEVGLINVINELPLKNSYDYKINFDQPLPQNKGDRDPFTNIMISKPTEQIPPFKKNTIPITIEFDNNPKLNVNTWSNEGRRGDQSYIQPLLQLN